MKIRKSSFTYTYEIAFDFHRGEELRSNVFDLSFSQTPQYFVIVSFLFFILSGNSFRFEGASSIYITNIYIYNNNREERGSLFLTTLRFPPQFLELEGSNVGSSSPSVGEAIHAGSGRGVEQNFGHDVREDISSFRFLKNGTS